MICIYKIISPENRIYVGQTTNYFKRIKNYNNLKCKSQTILYRSFKKYGVNNHIFDIIELCELEQLIDELSIISGISKSWLYKILGNFVDNKTNYKYHE